MQSTRRLTRCCRRSRLLYTTVIPFVVICILSGVIAALFHNSIPKTMEKAEWVNFTKSLVLHSDQRVTPQRFALLSLTMVSQYLAGVPFMNITKILYGYWFGFWKGAALCFSVEILCIYPVILYAAGRVRPEETLIHITDDLRAKNRLWTNLFILQMSGLPIYTRIPFLLHGAVTEREFTATFFTVALVMTMKNTLVGTLIYHYPNNAVVLGTIVGMLTLLPSVLTIYLGTSVLQSRSFWELVTGSEKDETEDDTEDDPEDDPDKENGDKPEKP